MAVRVGLFLQDEFLRMALRQLLRAMPGIAVALEDTSLQGGRALAAINAAILDVGTASADPAGFADLYRRYPGRTLLVGNDTNIAALRPRCPAEVVRISSGAGNGRANLASLSAQLGVVLRPLGDSTLAAQAARTANPSPPPAAPPPNPAPPPARAGRPPRPELVLIAVSTGGPDALQDLLTALDPPVCPVVIALHIPAEHAPGLARHLSAVTRHTVSIGEAGALPPAGVILLQGGMDHIVVVHEEGLWLRRVRGSGSVFHPNATLLLTSGAELGRAVVGVVLTGMGNDGSLGARALADRNHPVLAQTPDSCAVPGMSMAAIATGAVREIASPTGIAERLNTWFQMPPRQPLFL